MKIRNLNVSKKTLNFVKKEKIRILSATFALVTLFTLTGCNNKESKNTDIPSINIVDETSDKVQGEYLYVLNSDALSEDSIKYAGNNAMLLKEVDSSKYVNYSALGKTDGYFNANNYIVLPSCYEHYNNNTNNNVFNFIQHNNSKRELEIKQLESISGTKFVFLRNSIEMTKDLNFNKNGIVEKRLDGEKNLYKGDKLESYALIYDGKIVAFKQTGAGSDCDNVPKIGNIDEALKQVSNFIDKDLNTDIAGAKDFMKEQTEKINIKC